MYSVLTFQQCQSYLKLLGLEESLKGLPGILGHTEDSLWILESETRGLAEISN